MSRLINDQLKSGLVRVVTRNNCGDLIFIDYASVARNLIGALYENKPFSLIRFGDGENTLIQYPGFCSDIRVQYVLSRALENEVFENSSVNFISQMLKRSVSNADIVGLYSSAHPDPLCRLYKEHISELGFLRTCYACHPAVHFYLHECGALNELINNAKKVTLITGRDLSSVFAKSYPNVDFDLIIIKSENQFRLASENKNLMVHYPDHFFDIIKNSIKVTATPHLFLVGAGFLGKIYCGLIKSKGGIAVDVGSLFDYWASIPTREGYNSIVNGQIALQREITRPNLSLLNSKLEPSEVKSKYPQGFVGYGIEQSPFSYVPYFSINRVSAFSVLAKEIGPIPSEWRETLSLGVLLLYLLHLKDKPVLLVGSKVFLDFIRNAKAILSLDGKLEYFDLDCEKNSSHISSVPNNYNLIFTDQKTSNEINYPLQCFDLSKANSIFFLDGRIALANAMRLILDSGGYFLLDLKLISSTKFGSHCCIFLNKSHAHDEFGV